MSAIAQCLVVVFALYVTLLLITACDGEVKFVSITSDSLNVDVSAHPGRYGMYSPLSDAPVVIRAA
jgi:hypothetical protein